MNRPSDVIVVETPEHVELLFQPAGLGSRSVAYVIDKCLQIAIYLVLLLAAIMTSHLSNSLGLDNSLGQNWFFAFLILLYGMISLGYFIFFEYLWSGATPGKRTQNIRVIKRDGRPISILDAMVRNVVRSVDILGGIAPIGMFVMLRDKKFRRIGDFAAGTLVVTDERGPLPDLPEISEAEAKDPGLEDIARRLTPEQFLILNRFFTRRASLELGVRRKFALDLLKRITQNGDMYPNAEDPEVTLEKLHTLYVEKVRVL
jgi:uncharacterized RDD family membrane protein YckC